MKRAAVALILVLCVVGVVFLLMETTGERVTHRDAAGTSGTPNGSAIRDGDRGGAEDGTAGDDAGGDADPAADDDPNRIPGPPVTIRGRVVRDGQGVAGARVIARRARPWFQSWSYRWAQRQADSIRPPIAETEAVADGAFELEIARRRSVVLWAMHPGSAPASLTLFLPVTGDPDEVTIRLKEGSTLFGIVLNEESQPVADAAVKMTTSGYWSGMLMLDTKTEPDGRFVFAALPDGSVSVAVEAEGYPPTRRSVVLPEATHIQFVLGPGGTVVGRVTDSKGAPLADARVLLTTNDTTGHRGRADVRTDAAGEYRADGVRPGTLNSAAIEHPRCGMQVSSRGQIVLPTQLVKAGQELRYDIRLKPGVPVRGRTVMADGGAPVAGARVALLRMNEGWRGLTEIAYAASGEDGRFEFPHATKGTYALEAAADGAGRRAVRYMQTNRPLTIDFYVDGEQAPPEQRVELSPTGGIRGSVVGYTIRPGRRLTVQVETPRGSLHGYGDDVGNFVIENVPPMERAVVQCWTPMAKSDPFTVEAGQVAEVVLDPSGRGGFAGVVEDEQGRPIAGAVVLPMQQNSLQWNLRNIHRPAWNAARSDAAGRFLVSVQDWYYENQPGDWVVVATHPEHALGMSKPAKLPEKGASAEVKIVLKAAGAVAGRVEFEGGAPAPNVRVTASPKPVKDGQPFETRSPRSDMTDLDGRFEIGGIVEGVYSLSAYYRDGKVEAAEVRPGERDLKLVIRASASIGGFVVDEAGEPVANAIVSTTVASASGEQKRSGRSGQGGRFTITHLDPGNYPLVVEPQGQGWSAQNPGFETKHVDPVATGTEELKIVVAYGPTLKGRVIGHGGGPVTGAGVIAMPVQLEKKADPRAQQQAAQQAQQKVRPSAVTDGRGEFEIKGVGRDEVELIVLAQDHAPMTRRAVAGADRVTLRLAKGGVIEGRILKADGTPLASQWFTLQPASDVQAKINDWRVRGGQTWNYLGGWQLMQGRTDPAGAFQFRSLLPGEYSPYLRTSQGVLQATKLRTDAGAVTLRLQAPLAIRGRIVDLAGRVIRPDGFQVWVNARQGQTWLRGGNVASDGTFEIKGLPPGTVTLQVWPGNRYKPVTTDVTSGDLDVTIVLEPNQPKPPK
ncbi:MAG: carboxypeptidase regulatory-like domain-containing protein [Planctomycetota bacterium]|jgi:protocatechuate 3,4-dioxygenase beta subunit